MRTILRAILEGVPRDLAEALTQAGIATDPFEDAWAGLKNGVLIRQVEAAGYAALVTNDRNMAYQQNLDGRSVAVIALPSNKLKTLVGRGDDIADTIHRAVPGTHVVMNMDGSRVVHRSIGSGTASERLPPVRPFER